jgi:hypothetical protein
VPTPKPSPPTPAPPQTPPKRDRPARRFVGLIRTGRTGVLTERLTAPKRKTLLGE